MNAVIHFVSHALQNGRLATLILDASLKSLVVLAVALVFCACCRRAAAATRHLIWFGAVLGALCFPTVSLLLPAWQKPLWTVGTGLRSGNELAVVVAIAPNRATSTSIPGHGLVMPDSSVAKAGQHRSTDLPLLKTQLKLRWVRAAMLVWAAGFLAVLSSILIGQLRLKVLRRKGQISHEQEWESLLQNLCSEMQLRKAVLLVQSREDLMPMTWGVRRPVILLPLHADQWSSERKRVVLTHELAHIKRADCLTQLICRIACAVYWFNPLTWIASRQMCIERERACDDLVLDRGHKPSAYATHLFEIASSCRRLPQMAGIAMARSSQLKERISSIVLVSARRRPDRLVTVAVSLLSGGMVLAIGANQATLPALPGNSSQNLLEKQLAQLQSFSLAKLNQAREFAGRSGQQIIPEFQRFFEAATTGDSQTVTNMYEDFKRHHPQYSNGINEERPQLSTPYWSTVLEVCLAYDHVIRCEPKYTALLADGIINSIPAGSIYFGGTDPGRGIPTAFEKSQIEGDPFFVLTQNALADGTYLKYLRETYRDKIYTPTDDDSLRCFGEYSADALRRLEHDRQFPNEPKQIRTGENVRMENGKGAVSGQAAVMGINGLLTKLIFDQNPRREFYIEESLPLDWMYPYLEPHGLIMKINREPLAEISQATLAQDQAYWRDLVANMLGDWLNQDTSVSDLAAFVQKVYVQKDIAGFQGDRSFIQNDYAKRLFSKLRSSIAGVYAWRATHAGSPVEAARMATNADLAFKQAFNLCPYSPEAVSRFSDFLTQRNRSSDAVLLATAAAAVDPQNTQIQNLVQRLKSSAEAK